MLWSSETVSSCGNNVRESTETSLHGLLVPIENVGAGDMACSRSDADDGEASHNCGVLGEGVGITDRRDLGASRRKLQSKLFLSQFAQDGCLTSHCFRCQTVLLILVGL